MCVSTDLLPLLLATYTDALHPTCETFTSTQRTTLNAFASFLTYVTGILTTWSQRHIDVLALALNFVGESAVVAQAMEVLEQHSGKGNAWRRPGAPAATLYLNNPMKDFPRQLCKVAFAAEALSTVAAHPKGTWIAVANALGAVDVVEPLSLTPLTTLQCHSARVTAAAVCPPSAHLHGSPPGDVLALGCEDGALSLWRVDGAACMAFNKNAHKKTITAVAWIPIHSLFRSAYLGEASEDADRVGFLLTASLDCSIKVWQVRLAAAQALAVGVEEAAETDTLSPLRCLETLYAHAGPVTAMASHPTDPIFATSSWDQQVTVWAVETQGTANAILETRNKGAGKQRSKDNTAAAMEESKESLTAATVLDASLKPPVHAPSLHHARSQHLKRALLPLSLLPKQLAKVSSAPRCCAWAPSSMKLLAVGMYSGDIALLDSVAGHTLATFSGHSGPVTSVSWCSDARRLLSSGHDGSLRVWIGSAGGGQLMALRTDHLAMTAAAIVPPTARAKSAKRQHQVDGSGVGGASDSPYADPKLGVGLETAVTCDSSGYVRRWLIPEAKDRPELKHR